MADLDKLVVLRAIATGESIGNPVRVNFSSIEKTVDFSKEQLDGLLKDLNKERFIGQYAKKGADGFTFVLNQKGLDAIQDESFI